MTLPLDQEGATKMYATAGTLSQNARARKRDMAPPCSSLGQLSYAPTTQTTVVTTTTTTTTTFPPFVMRAPRCLKERDPEEYPLAMSPTPQSIKKLRFDLNGRSTYFEEAEDTEQRLHEVCTMQRALFTDLRWPLRQSGLYLVFRDNKCADRIGRTVQSKFSNASRPQRYDTVRFHLWIRPWNPKPRTKRWSLATTWFPYIYGCGREFAKSFTTTFVTSGSYGATKFSSS